jgi:hypothetical protein
VPFHTDKTRNLLGFTQVSDCLEHGFRTAGVHAPVSCRFQEVQDSTVAALTAIFGGDNAGTRRNFFQAKGKGLKSPIEVEGPRREFCSKGHTRHYADTSSYEGNGTLKGFRVQGSPVITQRTGQFHQFAAPEAGKFFGPFTSLGDGETD